MFDAMKITMKCKAFLKKHDVPFCDDFNTDTKIYDAVKLIDDFFNFIIERVHLENSKYSILLKKFFSSYISLNNFILPSLLSISNPPTKK